MKVVKTMGSKKSDIYNTIGKNIKKDRVKKGIKQKAKHYATQKALQTNSQLVVEAQAMPDDVSAFRVLFLGD